MQQKPPGANKPGTPKPRQIRLEIPANLSASYSNAVIVSHTHSEVVFDFVQIIPNDPRARVQSRVVMSPANAKMFLRALTDNLQKFESRHGEIKTPPRPMSLADQLFQGILPGDEDDDPEGDPQDE